MQQVRIEYYPKEWRMGMEKSGKVVKCWGEVTGV